MSDLIKILVTGSNGQLGSELIGLEGNYPNLNLMFTDVEELDITSEHDIEQIFRDNNFHFCINCAAYTAVDKAEIDVEIANLLNAKAAEYLARNSARHNVKYIQISTDFVFSGNKSSPYLEGDETKPLSQYGKSKLMGEIAALGNNVDTLVIRTSWLYSTYGNNFVKTMLRLSESKKELNVVNDQIGTPTYARDLASAILEIINSRKFMAGIYHYSNEGMCSWYDFAKAIFEFKGINIDINPIPTQEFPTPAKRPQYSVMSKNKIKNTYELDIPNWRDSLKTCMQQL